MLVQYEKRTFSGKEKIWVGAYANLHNLSHWHIEDEIIYVYKDTATISLNGEVYELKDGQCIYCQSGNVHYIKGSKNSIIYIFLIDDSLSSEVTSSYALESPLLINDYHFCEVFDVIKNELKEKGDFYEIKTNSIIMALISDIFRREKKAPYKSASNKTLLNYKNLLSEIDRSFDYITFSDAANFMGLSETYFSKLFKSICGMTFSQYLNNVRIEKAINILNGIEKYQITEIATKCGYSSIRHFNREFYEITGYTPKRLPEHFSLDTKPLKTIKDAFDPTLEQSKLIG